VQALEHRADALRVLPLDHVSSSQQRTTHSFPSRRASTRTLVAALQEPATFPGCGTFGA
jgi:hypothetical protein